MAKCHRILAARPDFDQSESNRRPLPVARGKRPNLLLLHVPRDVEGKLQTRQWDDDLGRRHSKTEVVASAVEMLSGRGKGAMHEVVAIAPDRPAGATS
jgi:hypothetical protein